MPLMPGLLAMPTVFVNAALSVVRDCSRPVRSDDTLAVVAPMYNEEAGAARALRSIFAQTSPADEIAISINGGADRTYDVVTTMLEREGLTRHSIAPARRLDASIESWARPGLATRVTVAVHRRRVAKSVSVNALVGEGIVTADRVLVVDGDTVLGADFVAALRDNFYRFTVRRQGGERSVVIEDFGLQSGAVTSFAPAGSGGLQRLISAGRRAEYAFAGMLRRGQARQLSGAPLLANSRLYTVVGCGFVARRDLFPMPTATRTEDHDFSLVTQAGPMTEQRLTPEALDRRGLRLLVDDRELAVAEALDPHDTVTLRRGGNARFVGEALMATEDPPHLNGYVHQVERWNGGAQENFLRRVLAPLPANVAYALWTAQLEDLLGIVLLCGLPLALALNLGNPTLGLGPGAVVWWLAIDTLLALILVGYGFFLQRRGQGQRPVESLRRAALDAASTLLPFLVLRYINPFTYLASATQVVPEHLRSLVSPPPPDADGVTWERPATRLRSQTQLVFTWVLIGFGAAGVSLAQLAPFIRPVNRDALRHLGGVPFELSRHATTPLRPSLESAGVETSFGQGAGPDPGAPALLAVRSEARQPRLSRFCDPDQTPRRAPAAPVPRLEGDAGRFGRLGQSDLLTLARLAPLAPLLESAAVGYGVPADLLLKVLINESYLDPLAVGPTEDRGLAQVTGEALTLLHSISHEAGSPFYNPALIPETFSVFDPDFSICAGAAKLAWALSQPGAAGEAEAYALYINPLVGLPNGRVGEQHRSAVAAMLALGPLVERLADAYAAYRGAPDQLSAAERDLITVSVRVGRGELTLEDAYRRAQAIVEREGVPDAAFYAVVLDTLYAPSLADAGPGSAPGDDPDGVDDAGDVTQQGEQDVEEELPGKADLEQDAERG